MNIEDFADQWTDEDTGECITYHYWHEQGTDNLWCEVYIEGAPYKSPRLISEDEYMSAWDRVMNY